MIQNMVQEPITKAHGSSKRRPTVQYKLI